MHYSDTNRPTFKSCSWTREPRAKKSSWTSHNCGLRDACTRTTVAMIENTVQCDGEIAQRLMQ
jgi:hypothetical protein